MKKTDYYRSIRAATSYRAQILEMIDDLEAMIESLEYAPDYEKEELLIEIKTENETMKGLVQEYKKRSNEISFSGDQADVDVAIRGITNILSRSNRINSKIQYREELEKKKNGIKQIRTIRRIKNY